MENTEKVEKRAYISKKKERAESIIFDLLNHNTTVDASKMVQKLKESGISKSSAYRILSEYEKSEKISKISYAKNGKIVFAYEISQKGFVRFRCKKCNSIIKFRPVDVQIQPIIVTLPGETRYHIIEIEKTDETFTYTCMKCKDK